MSHCHLDLWGVSLWHFHICLQCTLVRFILTIILPYPSPAYLKWFWQVSLFYFHTSI
jgi:hypothetical protein